MKHNIKVTIGLCAKNAEATIGHAIDSIIMQDFPHKLMELIIVDGYSKDRTLDVVRSKLKGSKIEHKIFREKKGLGHARQVVVDNARGEFIVWVDADMILSKDFVRKQVSFMESHPKVGIAKGRYGVHERTNLIAMLEDIEFAINFRHEGEPKVRPLGTSGCIYRVKAIKQVGGFDPHANGPAEDADAEYRIKTAGWSLWVTSAIFYEKRRDTWKSLWNEYFWHGKGGAYIFEKNRKIINIYRMWPPVALISELLRIPIAYRLTRKATAFLLVFHYIFKRVAWFLGFIDGKIVRRFKLFKRQSAINYDE